MLRFPTPSELRFRAKTFWAQSATNKIAVVCTLVFLAQSLKLFFDESLMLNALWIRGGFWLNFLSYGFLHGGLWHWALNMLALYFAGNAVERYDTGKNALPVFLGGVFLGGLAWFALVALLAANPLSQTLVGASAGICALFAYFSIEHRDAEINAMLFFLFPVRMRAWLIFAVLAGISVLGLVFSEIPSVRQSTETMMPIAHSAHLGGLVFGAAYALVAERLRRRFGGNVRYFRR